MGLKNSVMSLCLLVATAVYGASGGAEFIHNGLLPVQAAVGGRAISNGTDALFGNPSGLAGQSGWAFSGSGFSLYEMDYGVLSGVWGNHGLGVGAGVVVGRFGSNRTAQLPNGRLSVLPESVGYTGTALTLGIGGYWMPSWRWGVSGVVINETLDGVAATGMGLDFGTQLTVMPGWDVGLMAKRLIQPQMAWQTSSGDVESVDTDWVLGTGLTWGMIRGTAEVSIRHGLSTTQFGLMTTVLNWVPVWIGVSSQGFSAGTGLILDQVSVALTATQPSVDGLDPVYRLGLTVKEDNQ